MTLDDPERLAAVAATGRADGAQDDRLTAVARQLSRLTNTDVGLVTLVDARQSHPGRHGLELPVLDRRDSCCAVAIADAAPLVVGDLAADPRFAEGRVVRELGMRFYAGQPIAGPGGELVGAVCVLDGAPREDGQELRDTLRDVAAWAELELAAGARAEQLADLQARLIGSAAHELRTPLTGVRSHAELLLDDPELPPHVRQSVMAILDGAVQLQRGTDTVLRTLRDEAAGAEAAVRRRLGL